MAKQISVCTLLTFTTCVSSWIVLYAFPKTQLSKNFREGKVAEQIWTTVLGLDTRTSSTHSLRWWHLKNSYFWRFWNGQKRHCSVMRWSTLEKLSLRWGKWCRMPSLTRWSGLFSGEIDPESLWLIFKSLVESLLERKMATLVLFWKNKKTIDITSPSLFFTLIQTRAVESKLKSDVVESGTFKDLKSESKLESEYSEKPQSLNF